MEFKGTPTPWIVREGNGLLFVESSKETLKTSYGQEILADDYHNEDWKKHDAKLIAAAPDLLKALKMSQHLLNKVSESGKFNPQYGLLSQIADNRKAIEKALK